MEPRKAMRMPLIDILHRSFLFGLLGVGAIGIITGVQVHLATVSRGKGILFVKFMQFVKEMERQKETALREGKEIDDKALAEAAQKVLSSRYAQT